MQQLQWLSGCMKDKRKWFWLAMALARYLGKGLAHGVPVHHAQQITGPGAGGANAAGRFRAAPDTAARPAGVRYDRRSFCARCVRYGMTASLEYVSQNVQQDIRRHLYDNLCPGRGLLLRGTARAT